MSVESEITRLSTAKDDIASAIEDKGVTVPNGTKLDGMPVLISQIDGGAGKQDKITASGILKGDGQGGVTAAEAGTDYATPAQVNAKYTKPSGGIPASDLASGVIPTVPSASSTTPKMDGTASAGSGTTWAKGDHVHPTDTSRQAKITASGILKGNGSGGVSTATAGTDYATPAQVNAKYTKPSGGIPDTDIVSAATWNAKATKPTKKSITLSTTWSGDDPYTQVVTVSGYTLTANSKVDLQPDATTLNQLMTDGVKALYVENSNGSLIATAIGAAPTVSLSVQCTISEVTV